MLRRRQRSPSPSANILSPPAPLVVAKWDSLMYCKKSPNDCMVSASKTKNYLMDDPFCDWLNLYYVDVSGVKPKETPGFLASLFQKGIKFEEKIMEELISIYKKNVVVINTEGANGNNDVNFNKTKDHIYRGTPIIAQAVLFNYNNNTFGCADLIVRSDYLNKIVKNQVLTPEEINIKAEKMAQYHYRVIDIKWTTLPLRAKADTLRKEGFMPAYKGQLAVYNCALGDIQGYTPDKTFILGKGWKRDGPNGFANNSFDRLGVIDYAGIDSPVIEQTAEALNWFRELKEKGPKWTINDKPEKKHKCMFPNMRIDDAVWNKIKKEIALVTKEVTLICHVGKKQRDLLHAKGVYKFTDEDCCSANMGMKYNETAELIDNICSINRDSENDILPQIIESNDENWQTEYPTDMFFDFETFNTDFMNSKMDVYDSKKNSYVMIFMIGVGYMENGQWIFKVFTIDTVNEKEEKNCMDGFTKFVLETSNRIDPNHKYPRRLFHWTNAEISGFNNMLVQYDNRWKDWEKEVTFCDMYKVFLKEGIAVKGAYNYKLKAIGNSLNKLGKINMSWPEGKIGDGLDAMFEAAKIYDNKIKNTSTQKDQQTFDEIIRYNEIDCRMVYEIINYLRKNHRGLDANKGKNGIEPSDWKHEKKVLK